MFSFRLLRPHFNFNKPKARPDAESRPPISALLIDVSGNLHVDNTPTPRAIEALRKLTSAGIPYRLCSNTSKESTYDLVKKLDQQGFGIQETQQAISEGAVRDSDRKSDPKLVWTSIGAVSSILKDVGSTNPYLILSDSARSEVLYSLDTYNQDETKFDSVVVGLTPPLLDYEHLDTAFRILKGEYHRSEETSKQPILIATHRAKYIQSGDGKLSMGPGPFVTALENASGTEARVVGKPEATFFEMVIKDFGFPAETLEPKSRNARRPRIAVIGDDIEADLGGGAVQLGLWRILVKTGKYRHGDEVRPTVTPPDEIHESFAEFVDHLLERGPQPI